MSKRTKKNQPASGEAQAGTWYRLLLLLPLTPLAAGILLILGSTFDIMVRILPLAQTLLDGLFVLGSFSAFNVIQKQWALAAGWLLLGVGAWLGLT